VGRGGGRGFVFPLSTSSMAFTHLKTQSTFDLYPDEGKEEPGL